MKCVVLQSVCNNYESIISLTGPINKRYAEYYKANYILHKQAHSHNRHPAWNKIYSTLDLMRSGKYDYILFLDGDAVVIDITRDIFNLGRDNPNILLHLCSDGVHTHPFDVNSGVFLVKCNKLMIQFFDKILYNPALSGYYTERNWEQSVIQYELNQDVPYFSKIVNVYDSNYFNHYHGDWVFHPCHYYSKTPQVGNEIKIKMLKEKIARLSVDQQLYTTSEGLSSALHTLAKPYNTISMPRLKSHVSNISHQARDLSQQPRDYFK